MINKKSSLITLIIFINLFAFSQNREQLKKQFDFAQKVNNSYEGYAKSIGTNDFNYHSVRNDVSDALLTRCTDGNMEIEWETQLVPETFNDAKASFVWIAALDLTDKNYFFDVYVNDVKRFQITSGTDTHWEIENKEGGKLEYITFFKDQHGDAHGYMTLTAPKEWIAPGKALKIKIAGENKQDNTWIIVYKATDVIPYLSNASQYEIWMDLTCMQQGKQITFKIQAPEYLEGKTLDFEFAGKQREITLSNDQDFSEATFTLENSGNQHLLIRDGKNRIVDVEDIRIENSKQIILAESILINKVNIEGEEISISARRVYCPATVQSMLELENSNLGDGTIYLMNSSHQDIAWMDSPEKCVLERDTMLLAPLIEDAQRNLDYRFDIEDALMIKEYIERHPDEEPIVKQMLSDGRISCGASYTQPYEEMYSGEALARQFYFGRKWLMDRFGYDANTYWNMDVPGRTPQMPQIMKKANVDYLMISRHERGIFNWESPDGSSVLTFSPGHYADAFAALNKDFFESAQYIASSSLDWQNYYEDKSSGAAIPLLSDWDMSPAKDYSQLITNWEDISQLEIEPGKELEVRLPKIKLSTAPDFLKDFEHTAVNVPSLKGERPAVWIYIHGPGHQKALKASREGDILLPVAEKFATMNALVNNSFANYPQQRLTEAWEAKIYPDHGWGGKQGQITDALFRRKFEFARDEAKHIIDRSTQSIASHIKTNGKKGIPIVIFNSLNWERKDVLTCQINLPKGEFKDFIIKDSKSKEIQHQKEKVNYYEDGSIKTAEVCFVAESIPSLGYSTYYISNKEAAPNNVASQNSKSFENKFYKISFTDGGLSSIFDKESGVELLNTDKFKGGEIFTMKSEGYGAGEFDNVQAPGMEGFDKTSNYRCQWKIVSEGAVYSSYKMRQDIRNATVELTVTIYNSIKKIDFDVSLLNWEGVLYREYRMAMPLNMESGQVSYEVPFGVSEVGRDEIPGAAGERYQTPAVDIHPRGIENWIGASNNKFGVTLSSSVAVADFIDPTEPSSSATILQTILLASRKSCHPEGNEYLQTGNHYFSFSLTSHNPGWENGFRFGKQANERLFTIFNPTVFKNAYLPEIYSFFKVNRDNVIVSAIKKSEQDDAVVVRMYDILGKGTDIDFELNFNPEKSTHCSLIEDSGTNIQSYENIVPVKLGAFSIETFKFVLQNL